MRTPASGDTTATSLCEIEDVTLAEPDPALLSDVALESPRAGDRRDTWTLPLSGWAVGTGAPVRRVEVRHRNLRCSLPVHDRRRDLDERHPGSPWAATAGFSGAIGLLRLPPRFTVRVLAEAEGGRSEIAEISGRRAALRTGYEPELRPVMVTTLGRTGSTWLIHLLASHPAVTAYRPFTFEPRAATYWVDVLAGLGDPASFTQQVEGEVSYPGPWWLGSGARMTSELIPDEELSRWLGSDHVADLAAFAQQRIDALYLRVGADRPRPELFAEKCLPEGNVPQLLWELYPDAREVFLVRDFRDMLCSIRAFNQQRGRSSFGLESGDTDEAGYVRRVLAPSVERLLAEWRARADRAHLIRYEDLIARPADTLRAALAYLGVDSSSERARETLAQASAPIPGMAAHSTAADPAASVGRWRHELEPAQREVCEAAFGEALDEFGYER